MKERWEKEREGGRKGNMSMNLIPDLYLRMQPQRKIPLNPLNNTPVDQNLLTKHPHLPNAVRIHSGEKG